MRSSVGNDHIVRATVELADEPGFTAPGSPTTFEVVIDLNVLALGFMYVAALRNKNGKCTEAGGALVVRVKR